MNNEEKMVQWLEQEYLSIPTFLMSSYKQLGLNEDELILLLQVQSFIQIGNSFPTPTEISNRMTWSTTKCTEQLRALLQRGYITIQEEHDEKSVIHEKYSLKPLWEKVLFLFLNNSLEKHEQSIKQEFNLYSMFEQEFGRPLSPLECESLSMWIDEDHHDPTIIKAALREAVMSGKLNFRYIDRILFEWKKNGIKTIEQALNHSRKFRQFQNKQRTDENQQEYKRTIPFFNWLEN